jgi:hypothetical protein
MISGSAIADTETITADHLADILRVTPQWIYQMAAEEAWEYVNGDGQAQRVEATALTPTLSQGERGNGQARRFVVERLPAEIQERILRFRYGVDEDNLNEMVQQFSINVSPRAFKDPQAAAKIRMVCECLAVPKNVRGRNGRIKEIAESYGYHVSAVYKMIKQVKQGKPLIQIGKTHGITVAGVAGRLRAWDVAAADMAVRSIMQNKREQREKLRLYAEIEASARASGWKIGTYENFCQIYRRVDQSVITYRDKGARGLREDVIPPIARDFSAYRPMECLVGDQHKADFYALDAAGEVATLELFCWLDFRTQMVWGAIAYQHYNRYTVGQALLNAVRWGLPSTVYTDWGKPEGANYITLLLDQITGLGIKTQNIRHTRAKVRHPQAKPIEGWFGRLDKNLRNEGLPGYCKRLRDTRENELQQKELKELIRRDGLLTVPELVARILDAIETWNRHNFKNRGADTGYSPLDIYRQETAVYPVTALSQDVLDYIFLPMQTGMIRRSQVKVRHEFLKKTITYYHPDLADHGGTEVTLRYNPFDISHVWIFATGKLVCRAEEWGMINPKNSDQVMDRIEKQNSLLKQIKGRYAAYAPVAAGASPIPRLHPQEREARQVRAATELRVLKTPLDDAAETVEMKAVAGDPRGYRPLEFNKTEPVRLRPLFALDWDKPVDDD